MEEFEVEGKIVMFVFIDGEVVGFVVVVDMIKDMLWVVVVCLKELGLDVIMMIGDNCRIVEVIVREVGIMSVIVEVFFE